MSSNNLNIRLRYLGGKKADDRMTLDKTKSLKKALLYSYQAETAVLEDGREFRCLINPDKLKNDYDNKIISIPFFDVCLNKEFSGLPTSMAEEPIGIKVGDVFKWKETDTYWLVYLQYLEESAYFRAEIRKCSETILIDGKEYYAYIRGPVETQIRWNQKSDIVWNSLNYTKIAYVREDEHSSKLKRFDIVKINGNNFEVQAVNKDTASDGIIIIHLKEYYSNSIEEQEKSEVPPPVTPPDEYDVQIKGDLTVYPYDKKVYTIANAHGGTWSLSNKKAKILAQNDEKVAIEIVSGRSGKVDLIYSTSFEDFKVTLNIESL